MVLISGENFAGRANEDFGQVKPVLQALLTCLLQLHNAGIVHGDVKPRNIMRTGGISSFLYRLRRPSSSSAECISCSSNTLQFPAGSSISMPAPVSPPLPALTPRQNFAADLLAPNAARCVFSFACCPILTFLTVSTAGTRLRSSLPLMAAMLVSKNST